MSVCQQSLSCNFIAGSSVYLMRIAVKGSLSAAPMSFYRIWILRYGIKNW